MKVAPPKFPSFDSGSQPAAVPPVIDPARCEDYAVFRESFLLAFSRPDHNAALRTVGKLIHEVAQQFRLYWPLQPEGRLRAELRAIVADLRHVQGNLTQQGGQRAASSATSQEMHLSLVAAGLAGRVREIADALEAELGPWRGEE